MSGLWIIALLIILVRSFRSGSSGVSGNTRANPYRYAHIGCLWLFLITLYGLVSENAGTAQYLFYPVCAILVFPSFFSFLTSLLGAYKTSYLLGRMSMFYFGRSAYAGALYRGLQAADRIKRQSDKTAALYWLKSRYLKRSRAIYSGEMALIVIIEAKLKKPGDARYVAKQLDLLEGMGKSSIPGPVSRYASKISLAPALSDGDWSEILRKARQWDTPGYNPLAKYLIYYFHRHIEKSEDLLLPAVLIFKLIVVRYKHIYRLPQYLKEPSPIDIDGQETDVLSTQWLMQTNHRCNTDNHGLTAQFSEKLSKESRTYWLGRSEQLGAWNLEESWKSIEASVDQYTTMMTSKTDEDNEGSYDSKEQRFNNLKYISDSIEYRLDKQKTTSGIGDFLDWLNIWQNLNELKHNDQDLNTAFSMIHDTMWNWIALMWNRKTNRCLAHYMATVCSPIAGACGLEEFYDTLRGIELGLYC